MKTFPILYKTTNGGKIQVWSIEVEGNAYRTISGQSSGKKTISNWTFTQAKNIGKSNSTTPEEQALKDAEAIWTRKVESGYFESIEEATSGVKKFFAPMLAEKYSGKPVNSEEIYLQPKLDGIRCVVSKDGMFSRNGKPIVAAPHIRKELHDFFMNYPNLILDGELYADKFNNDFNAICSLVKKTKPSEQDLIDSANVIEYHVYDVFNTEKPEETYLERFITNLPKILDFSKYNSLKLVDTKRVTDYINSESIINDNFDELISRGYEGQMIRLNRLYEPGRRSNSLLKHKEFQDAEYEIVFVGEGQGNKSGTAAYMTLKDPSTGTEFNSNIKCNRTLGASLLQQADLLKGKKATVQYANLTPDGIPRFPYVIKVDRDSYE